MQPLEQLKESPKLQLLKAVHTVRLRLPFLSKQIVFTWCDCDNYTKSHTTH